jgi:hypothetical protein
MSASPDKEPATYFEIEQRRLTNPGEDKISASDIPSLPPTSPWHHDPVPAEPTIDRSREDGDTTDMTDGGNS